MEEHFKDKQKSPLAFLRDNENIKYIEESEIDFNTPSNVDGLAKSGLETIKMYLDYPITRDTFEENTDQNQEKTELQAQAHRNRTRWWMTLPKDVQAIYTRNKLVLNNVGAALGGVDFIIIGLGINREDLNAALVQFKKETTKEEWVAKDDDEKEIYIKEKLIPFLINIGQLATEKVA